MARRLTVYLVDTNVWLERLLDQARSGEVDAFFTQVSPADLFVSDFAFHSVAVVLGRLKHLEGLLHFVQDVFIEGSVSLVHLEPQDTGRIIQVMTEFNLDFDDAYQYVAAEKYKLTIVSFDDHFDRTERGRLTPGQAPSS